MQYAKIIESAWKNAWQNRPLTWLVFIPCFATIVILTVEIALNVYLSLNEFGYIEANIFQNAIAIWEFITEKQLLFLAVVLAITIIIAGFLIPPLTTGALLLAIQKNKDNPDTPPLLRRKLLHGLKHYFRLFQFSVILAPLSFATVILFVMTFSRYSHDSFLQLMWPLVIAYVVLSVLIQFASSYAPYLIVYKGMSPYRALFKSCGYSILFFGTTLSVTGLMIIINLRILINALVLLGVPTLIVVAIGYFQGWLIAISILLGLVLAFLAAYLTAFMEVFLVSLWAKAYWKIEQELEEDEEDEDKKNEDDSDED